MEEEISINKDSILKLEKIAKLVRRAEIDMIYNAKSGHPGGSLSCTDILVCLYHYLMNLELNKKGQRTDRIVLSKGHAAPALYATLATKGFIAPEELKSLRKVDSNLEGHPSNKINGVDSSSGSLGQGLSIANGMAFAHRLDGTYGNVYCILGDGELEEGQVWEAAMTAGFYKLSNVIAFVDYNCLQIDGKISEIKSPEPIGAKFMAFNWNVVEIDGHDIEQIISAVKNAKKIDRPTCIICYTIKGKGVSFMENNVEWHGKSLNEEEYKIAMKELK